MAKLTIALFGGVMVSRDGKPVNGFESNKARALLAYLATETDRPHSREKLSALLWPDMPEQAARNNLRYTLSNLRKVLGDLQDSHPLLIISQQTIQLDLGQDIDVDVLAFGRRLAGSSPGIADLEEAVRLYRGDFLEGFSVSDDSAFEEWAILKREQLRRQALDALHRLAQAHEKNKDIASALPVAWRQVDLEPWSEEAHRYLMRLLGLNGQRSAALTQYETCRRILREELDVEPSIETVRLYEQIRAGKLEPVAGTQEIKDSQAGKKSLPDENPLRSDPGTKPPERRNKFVAGLKLGGIGLLVLAVAAAGVFYLNKVKSSEQATTAVKGKIVTSCPEQSPSSVCVTDSQTGRLTEVLDKLPFTRVGPGMSWSPDGNRIAFDATNSPIDSPDNFDLYIVDADGSDLQQITRGDKNDILPAWSPDGSWIAFHRNCALWIIRPDGTQDRPLSNGLCAFGMAWSPDSQWIAFLDVERSPVGQPSASIRVFQLGGSEARIVYVFDQPVQHGEVAWSPDGGQIFCVFDSGGSTQNTVLIDAAGHGALKKEIEIPVSWFKNFWPQWGKVK